MSDLETKRSVENALNAFAKQPLKVPLPGYSTRSAIRRGRPDLLRRVCKHFSETASQRLGSIDSINAAKPATSGVAMTCHRSLSCASPSTPPSAATPVLNPRLGMLTSVVKIPSVPPLKARLARLGASDSNTTRAHLYPSRLRCDAVGVLCRVKHVLPVRYRGSTCSSTHSPYRKGNRGAHGGARRVQHCGDPAKPQVR